jgi:hypothetical protein
MSASIETIAPGVEPKGLDIAVKFDGEANAWIWTPESYYKYDREEFRLEEGRYRVHVRIESPTADVVEKDFILENKGTKATGLTLTPVQQTPSTLPLEVVGISANSVSGGTFVLFFGSAVSAFVAVGANFLLLFTVSALWRILRLSAFLTSLVLLFLFLVYFFGGSIAELQTLREAAQLPLPLSVDGRLEKLQMDLMEFRKQLEEALMRDKENTQKNEQLIERIKKAQLGLLPEKESALTS